MARDVSPAWPANGEGLCRPATEAGSPVTSAGTPAAPDRFLTMTISHLLEESLQIAWEYLERTGELGDGAAASRFLSEKIEAMIRHGERSRQGR